MRLILAFLAVTLCAHSASSQCIGQRTIVFVQEHARVQGGMTIWRPDIWIMNTDGSAVTRLSRDSAAVDPGYSNDPAWSPDGSKLVFVSDRGGTMAGDLFVMDAVDADGDLEGDNRLSFYSHQNEQFSPHWKPDESAIAFVDEQGSVIDIVQLPFPPVGGPTNVVTSPQEDLEPEFSPDGSELVFLDGTGNTMRQIKVLDLGTGAVRSLSNVGIHQSPSFSPDGSRLLFSSAMQGNHFEIYVMDAVDSDADGFGDGLTRLTNTPSVMQNLQPKWSPDGSCILFTRQPDVTADPLGRDVYVMDVPEAV